MTKRRRREPKHFSQTTRRGGNEVNEYIPLPESPGPWVDEDRCVCQAHPGTYKKYNSQVSFGEASAELRLWNKDNENTSGGWRSQGPVLHMMRVIKLRRWYEAHGGCYVEIPADPDDWEPIVWALYDQATDYGYEGEPQDYADAAQDYVEPGELAELRQGALTQGADRIIDDDDDDEYDDDDDEYDDSGEYSEDLF